MKKLLALLLACCLLLSGTALAANDPAESLLVAPVPSAGVSAPGSTVPPASEALPEPPAQPVGPPVPDGPHPFVRVHTYTGEFSDLTVGSTFYANVSGLYEYGLSVGKGDGTYGLKDSATVGQGIIFASRLRSLYDYGDAEIGANAFRQEGQRSYMPHLLYLQHLNVLGSELDGLYFTPASRAAMAHILANALPAEAFTPINHNTVTQGYASRRYIQDVTEYTAYYQDILTLYRYGICQGVDSSGTYLPNAAITRGALAAMLTRMVDPSLRIELHWNLNSAEGTTWSSLVDAPASYDVSPSTDAEFDGAIRWMLSREALTLQLNYGKAVDNAFVSSVLQQALKQAGRYSENMLNHVSCSYYASSGKMTLTFSISGATQAETTAYRKATLDAAIQTHDYLWDSGLLTASMTETEKARVYYNWICQNCRYDTNAGDTSLSHTAYSLFTQGLAVCDGYTGAYNLLLKLEGIDCYTLSGSNHAWTVATLDGTEVHIDTTWGDGSPYYDGSGLYVNYDYFAMTPAISYSHHPW